MGNIFFKVEVIGIEDDIDQLKQKLKYYLKLSSNSLYLLDSLGNEITSTVSFLEADYFLISDRLIVQNVYQTSLLPFILKHESTLQCFTVIIKSEQRSKIRNLIKDIDLNGLPSLRSLQKTLLDSPQAMSQSSISTEHDLSGESQFDLKVQRPEPSPYV